MLKRSTVITRMRSDEGLVSEVYNRDNREDGPETARLIEDVLAPLVRGADPQRDPVWPAVWANRPAVKDGMMDVPTGPGFGLVLDETLIRRHRVT